MKNLLVVFLISAFLLQCKNDTPKSEDPNDQVSAPEQAAVQNPVQAAPIPKLPSEPSQRTEIGNFEFWHHIKNNGPKPQPSQAVFYHYQMRRGAKVVQSNFGDTPSGGIMATEEEAKKNPQALVEGLRQMAVGDSLTIVFPVGNVPDSHYVYEIVLRSIYDR